MQQIAQRFKERVPEKNAAVVDRVLEAGAVIPGKTNVPEFGMVGTCENSLGVLGRNPWNTDCTPGGSSGGAAAAVAAYLCPMATGSDGGGSLRIPANLCGVYAIKPTQGRVSGYTGLGGPPRPNIFSQSGPIARTVRDSALLLQVMAGFDRRDNASIRYTPPNFIAAVEKDIKGLRIGWSPDFGFADVFPEVLEVTSAAATRFESLGCSVESVGIELQEPYDSFGPIQAADVFSTLGQYVDTYGERMTPYAQFMLERGSKVTAKDYMEAHGRIAALKATFADLFENYDLIMSPVSRFPAFANEDFPGSIQGSSSWPEQYWNGAFTMHGNAIGHPAASVPAGFSSDGLPIGLQIIGRMYDEETVLAASAAFERAYPWIQHRPLVS